jgi:uncharacterized protein (DUF486 family)
MRALKTIVPLIVYNTFMTFAWYGHVKFKEVSLWRVFMLSWTIAFFGYCFQAPALQTH